MPEARDRLERPVDHAAILFNRRQSGVLLDESPLQVTTFGSPVQRSPFGAAGRTPLRLTVQRTFMHRGGLARRLGNRRGLTPYRMPSGRENTPGRAARRVRRRVSTSFLPSWYPRTPLRDITSISRAFERRRARLGEVDGQEVESPTPQREGVVESSVEQDSSMATPAPTMRCRPSTANVHKILLDITNEHCGESEFLTPQKKLLNSIDKVEKVVMEEIQKLKSTPSAKRAEREKRVRTLMSMR